MIEYRSIYFDTELIEGRVLDIFESDRHSAAPAFFFVHGGGWRSGSRTIFHRIALEYYGLGFDAASTDYRLKGVTVFEQVEDVREGLRIFADQRRKKSKSDRVILIGSSAGAHLALLAAMQQPIDGCCIAGICVQSAPFLFRPWDDIFPGIWTSMQAAVGASFATRPDLYGQASPLDHVGACTPPVLILHAGNEHMFPLSHAEQFAERCRDNRVACQINVYPRAEHGFFYSLERWQQKRAFVDILEFFDLKTAATPG